MWIYRFLGGKTLGHGRALETFLAFVCAVYAAILILAPDAIHQSQAIRLVAWYGYGWIVILIFIAKSVFTSLGVIGNIKGWSGSRIYRTIGAFIGTSIWCWFLSQFVAYDALDALGSALCIGGIVASVRIIGMAWANLPRPGAIGTLGDEVSEREAKLLISAQLYLTSQDFAARRQLANALQEYEINVDLPLTQPIIKL
jgi:hypothetical protein